MKYNIIQGDCLEVLRTMPDCSVQCCVTSPPYWGLRDYGVTGQLGLEKTPEAYVARIVEVFREVRRVLRNDGTLWLNLGDTFAANGACGGGSPVDKRKEEYGRKGYESDSSHGRHTDKIAQQKMKKTVPIGLKPKDLVGIPWRVAFALQADGWWLRQDIIWHKPNPMPESVTDRCTKAHEYIFLMSKSERYYFDTESIREPASTGWNNSEFHTGKSADHQMGRASKQPRFGGSKYGDSQEDKHRTKSGNKYSPNGYRNRRSVWTVATQPFKEAHFATFPPNLIEPCIMAGSRESDTILDPFNGAGTTGLVSMRHNRQYIGIELNPDYCEIARKRIRAEIDKAPLLA